MNARKIGFLLSILLSIVGTKVFAYGYDIAVENADGVIICYNYINDGKELEVVSGDYSGVVVMVIPEEVTYMNRTRKVTSIGYEAFFFCSGLTSVTIPNSVTSIGDYAFYGSGLTSVTIPNSVTSIGDEAFDFCSGLISVNIIDIAAWCKIAFFGYGSNPLYYANHLYLNGKEIKDLVIPNSVTSIGDWAFCNCSGLTSVTIPNSVTSIGYEAFFFCSGLTSVTIPNSVTSIGKRAFDGWDLPEVISKIENPFIIIGKSSGDRIFNLNTFNNATLYVPIGTIDKYKATEGWKDFLFIEEGDGGGSNPPEEQKKCEKPTISYSNGKLTFSCATEGVSYQYNVSASIKSGEGNNIDFTPKFTITAYATKDGYDNSETATLEVLIGDANCDGIINAADITTIVNIIMGQ